MNGISTITKRGQVVVPQPIRELFDLKPSDKLYFKVENNKIVVRPIFSIDEALGVIKTKKKVGKKELKEAVVGQIIKKFKKR